MNLFLAIILIVIAFMCGAVLHRISITAALMREGYEIHYSPDHPLGLGRYRVTKSQLNFDGHTDYACLQYDEDNE